MLNAINNKPLCKNNNFKALNSNPLPKVSFAADKNTDSSEKKASNLAIKMLAATSVALLALTRYKTGTILKKMNEDVPFFTLQRLAKIKKLVSKDGATGLFNKAFLKISVNREYDKAVKSGKNYSIAMIDMDNFKAVNEVFGHDVGDEFISAIGSNVKEITKKHGVKGFRAGGEEFVITIYDKDAETAKKIVEEIAEAIKKDDSIQKYIPQFKEKANADVEFLSSNMNSINSIFPRLKTEQSIENCKPLADDIIAVIGNYIEKYDPADKIAFNEIIEKIKTAEKNELPNLFHVNTKFGEEYTLGHELNKIYTHYDEMKNDLLKWTHHINEHKMFTVSGGVVNLKDSDEIKNGACMIKIADEALKAAKEKGKNIVITANNDVIKRTVAKTNKK